MEKFLHWLQSNTLLAIGIIVGVIVLIILASKKSVNASDAAKLAQCLKDKGAKFYGASWCPHCRSQKAKFGSAASLLPYIECSNPDRSTVKVCSDAKITGYPTWVFADGTTIPGELTLAELKQYSGC